MSLIKCTAIIGSETVVEFDPDIYRVHGAVYVPLGLKGTPWGIYDHGRKFFLPAGTFRGPDIIPAGTNLVLPRSYETITNFASDACYIYAGWIHGHYGHFLLSSLSRLWMRAILADANLKILYHGPERVDDLLAKPFFSTILAALDLDPGRFVRFDELTIIRSLIVASPAFEESSFVHRCFSTTSNMLGRKIISDTTRHPSDKPVYLSKEKVSSGVGRLVNEAELTDILTSRGFDIVYPEQMKFPDQVGIFHDRKTIVGLTGSAMHTSIFAPGCSIVGVCYTNSILSNYHLLDKANGNDAHYFYPHDDIVPEERTADFELNYRLKDPVKTAGELLRITERVAARRNDLDWQARRDPRPLFGHRRNLAFGRPSRQSSFGPREWATTPAGRLSTATSGILTGRCQFHTDHEAEPWWMVDLGCIARIEEIRLHNRTDDSWDRCSCFSLSISEDGMEWLDIHVQDQPRLFGNGITGDPFVLVLDKVIIARYIRIRLLGTNWLHLDQVEVMGRLEPEQDPLAVAPAA